MKKGKKIIIFLTITLVAIIMVSLFYYSTRESLMEYLFENNQEQREKITSASGDQAQIMVDLANKQLAKQKVDTQIRKDEVENKSLFKEQSSNQATVKTQTDELPKNEDTLVSTKTSTPESTSPELTSPELITPVKIKKTDQVQNGYVVVDCKTGGVIACPHYEVQTGTSPLFYQKGKSQFLVGRCLDVSIDVKTFCP